MTAPRSSRRSRVRPRPQVRARDAPPGGGLERRIMPRDDTRFALRTDSRLSSGESFRESIIVGKLGVRHRVVYLDFWLDAPTSERLEVYWGQADTMLQASTDQKLMLLPFNSYHVGNRHAFWWPVGTGPVGILPESLSIRRQVGPPADNFYWTVWWTEERQ